MKYDGIIFDLDGTLWDSRECIAESWNLTVAKYGVKGDYTLDAISSIMGLTFDDIADRLFSVFGEKRIEMCRICLADEIEFLETHNAVVYDGVAEILARLSGMLPLFIVSNCQCGYIESFLRQSGCAAYITDFACEGSTGLKKAENISSIMQRYGLNRPVYVGDTAMDESSARKAGCAFIHAAYGFGSAVNPDAVINSPPELEKLLLS